MQKWSIFSIVVLCQIALLIYFRDAVFFWDTIQFAGMHASHFYENGFSFFLSQEMDSGHPPLFGNILALAWTLFGKSLIVSHFFMLPFLILNLFLALKIGEYFTPERPWLFMLLMFVCPYYLGHSILVSPDLVLISGFLMSLYAIAERKISLAYIAAILLCLISMRGCMIAAAFLIFICLKNRKEIRSHWNIILPFIVGLALFGLYQIAHYIHTDWIGFHEDSPWKNSFRLMSFKGIIMNTIVFIWRCIDYAIIFLVILFAAAIYKGHRVNRSLVFIFCLIAFVFFIVIVPFNGLLNHRYFLPLILLFLLMLSQIDWFKYNWLCLAVTLVLGAGNLLIYPKHIAQGWDSTLAHVPFYKVEKEMHDYLIESGIPAEEIGTAFPLKKDRTYISLEDTNFRYKDYDFKTDQYILYASVMNSFSDFELESLFEHWKQKKRIENGRIEIILFEKK